MDLLKGDCIECNTTKSAAVSLASFCAECGLDRTEVIFEVPSEKFDEVVRDMLTILDFHNLRPVAVNRDVPGYEELLKRLAI